jgi:hypothetical protein
MKSATIGSYSIHLGLTSAHLQIVRDPLSDPAYKFGCESGFLFDADTEPDADPGYQNDPDPSGSGSTTMLTSENLKEYFF